MFATARIVMGRRGKEFTETEEQLYRGLYQQTRLERERAFEINFKGNLSAALALLSPNEIYALGLLDLRKNA